MPRRVKNANERGVGGEIIAPLAASKLTRRKRRRQTVRAAATCLEVSMKTISTFSLLSLALLCALTACAAPARAQHDKSSAADTAEQPAPLPVRRVADKLARAGWRRYEIGDPARFSLILPIAPITKAERSKIIPGVWGTTHSYLSVNASGVYAVSYLGALPAALQNEARKRTFSEGFVKDFAEGFQAKMKDREIDVAFTVSEQRTAAVGGLAGYEQDFSDGEITGRVRLVFDAGSAYAVMAVWNDLSSNSEISAFFESLKVNTKR
jgi:hypothetical protein